MIKEINLTKGEIWHIVQVMKDRGTSHCKECEIIYNELKDYLEGKE